MIKLKNVTISKYKSIKTDQRFEVEHDVTVLVGKNESGKTAILEAIAKSNPFPSQTLQLKTKHDYPKDEYQKFKRTKSGGKFIQCTYQLSEELLEEIGKDIGPNSLNTTEVSPEVSYGDPEPYFYTIYTDEEYFFEFLCEKYGLTDVSLLSTVRQLHEQDEISKFLDDSPPPEVAALLEEISSKFDNESDPEFRLWDYVEKTWLRPNLPKYLYYSEYHQLPSEIDLVALRIDDNSRPELKTSRALFDLANLDVEELIADDDEASISALEGAGRQISATLSQYWTTNKNLRVKFHIPREKNVHGNPYLKVRVSDGPDSMTLPLASRSSGFRWFFSFFVWFSKIQEDSDSQYVLLLDEPGLSLHASAQENLLRFIEDLATDYQIIYTTHSPFMIASEKLHRVRTVADKGNGTQILDRVRENDPDTLFPMQAALGYDIAQNLYVSRNHLLVEGMSDEMYLKVMSSILRNRGRICLRDDISIVPANGVDKVVTYISFFYGQRLSFACLLDSITDKTGKQRITHLIEKEMIHEDQVIYYSKFNEDADRSGDIEDLFELQEYVSLFNAAFAELYNIKPNELDPNGDRIVKQISRKIGKRRFDHYPPAKAFSRLSGDAHLIGDDTLDRFENIFEEVNKLFPE